jgi:hypothetical protein
VDTGDMTLKHDPKTEGKTVGTGSVEVLTHPLDAQKTGKALGGSLTISGILAGKGISFARPLAKNTLAGLRDETDLEIFCSHAKAGVLQPDLAPYTATTDVYLTPIFAGYMKAYLGRQFKQNGSGMLCGLGAQSDRGFL